MKWFNKEMGSMKSMLAEILKAVGAQAPPPPAPPADQNLDADTSKPPGPSGPSVPVSGPSGPAPAAAAEAKVNEQGPSRPAEQVEGPPGPAEKVSGPSGPLESDPMQTVVEEEVLAHNPQLLLFLLTHLFLYLHPQLLQHLLLLRPSKSLNPDPFPLQHHFLLNLPFLLPLPLIFLHLHLSLSFLQPHHQLEPPPLVPYHQLDHLLTPLLLHHPFFILILLRPSSPSSQKELKLMVVKAKIFSSAQSLSEEEWARSNKVLYNKFLSARSEVFPPKDHSLTLSEWFLLHHNNSWAPFIQKEIKMIKQFNMFNDYRYLHRLPEVQLSQFRQAIRNLRAELGTAAIQVDFATLQLPEATYLPPLHSLLMDTPVGSVIFDRFARVMGRIKVQKGSVVAFPRFIFREYHLGHIHAEILAPALSECERLTPVGWDKFYPLSAQQLSNTNVTLAREGRPPISAATFLDMNSLHLEDLVGSRVLFPFGCEGRPGEVSKVWLFPYGVKEDQLCWVL
ncbi:hypothetical protein Taro_016156 [Colocasia esculenta]|uniref:Uncharacterized protein n=1 Tax=Colocasia esculenta TaxID=4460 RepID=A0A843UMU6_COLES|nr:hypothetical protein [Colocasia esculenta]